MTATEMATKAREYADHYRYNEGVTDEYTLKAIEMQHFAHLVNKLVAAHRKED